MGRTRLVTYQLNVTLMYMQYTCDTHAVNMRPLYVVYMHQPWSAQYDMQYTCTCTLHGYHMHTTWVSHIHPIDITCTPYGYHMYIVWISHAHRTSITYMSYGYHFYTMSRYLLCAAKCLVTFCFRRRIVANKFYHPSIWIVIYKYKTQSHSCIHNIR